MLDSTAMALISVLVFSLGWFGLGAWFTIITRWLRGQTLLVYEQRPPVPWGVLQMAPIVGLYIGMQGLMPLFWSEPSAADRLWSTAIANLGATMLAIAVMRWGAKASWSALGISTQRLGADTRLGLLSFAAAAPPMFVLQAVLRLWYDGQHPIENILKESQSGALFLAAAVSAVIAAPVAEELFFRGLLQPWLEKSLSTPTTDALESSLHGETAPSTAPAAAQRAIVMTSLIFALAHFGHGPAPIPLFLLSLVLGYLYSRRGRLWPCIVMHATLNGFSLFFLWLQQYMPVREL